MSGRFITIEGGEGSGKSSQALSLAKRLSAAGIDVVRTREPGGSPFAETLRDIILSGAVKSARNVSTTMRRLGWEFRLGFQA